MDLPAGRLDDALVHIDQALAAFERVDPFGRLPYVLLFKFAIHEERGEDEEALALAARGRELARQTGLAGWLGAGTSIRIASLQARLGDVAGAEAELADVGPEWHAWGTWELEATRAAIAAARGERAGGAGGRGARGRASSATTSPWFDRMRCAAVLAPALVRAGQPGRARAIVEADAGRPAARLLRRRAWARSWPGCCTRRATRRGSVAALAAAWEEAGDQARHVVRREWPRVERPLWAALEQEAVDPVAAVGAVADALPGGAALGPFTRHPVPAVRRAALLSAVAAGHPEGIERLSELRARPGPGRGGRRPGRGRAAAPRSAAAGLPPVRRASSCAAGLGGRARRSGSAAWPRGSSACCSAGPASR